MSQQWGYLPNNVSYYENSKHYLLLGVHFWTLPSTHHRLTSIQFSIDIGSSVLNDVAIFVSILFLNLFLL